MGQQPASVFGVFGCFRFILAAMVVVTHAGPQQFGFLGEYAVLSFFILSGYVVSFILHNRYLALPRGELRYAVNRFLRIYPLYWAVLIISLVLLYCWPDAARKIVNGIGIPQGAGLWVFNIAALGLFDPIMGKLLPIRVIPVIWTLEIEILYWALMPKLLASSKARCLMLAVAILYTAYALAASVLYPPEVSAPIRYFSVLAACLPFYIGLQLFRRKLDNWLVIPTALGVAAIALFFILVFFSHLIFAAPGMYGTYAIMVASGLVIAYLSQISDAPGWVAKLDVFLGDLSYPLYLVHIPVMYALITWAPVQRYSWSMWLITLLCATVASWLLHLCVQVPVNRLRGRIKQYS
jgi:peptidoglycan/LPS O-acetylase OafA/YrhL